MKLLIEPADWVKNDATLTDRMAMLAIAAKPLGSVFFEWDSDCYVEIPENTIPELIEEFTRNAKLFGWIITPA